MSNCSNHASLEYTIASQQQLIERLKQQLLEKDHELRQQEITRLDMKAEHEKKIASMTTDAEKLHSELSNLSSRLQEQETKHSSRFQELKTFLESIRPVFVLIKEKLGLPRTATPDDVLRALRGAVVSKS